MTKSALAPQLSAEPETRPQMHDGPTFRPLREPLRLAAVELADLARMGDDLQGVIARLAAQANCADAELLAEAQAADLLTQRLTGMAAFLSALATAAPRDVTTDVHAAVIDLTVAEQARRLSGPPPEVATQTLLALSDPFGGDVTLFGD